jgi:hypothetical protein
MCTSAPDLPSVRGDIEDILNHLKILRTYIGQKVIESVLNSPSRTHR